MHDVTEPGQRADIPFQPTPGAPTWDVRAVTAIMAKLSPPPAHDMADGWHAVPWDQGVAVQRIMAGHHLRPNRAGRARDAWDALIRADREHLRAHDLEIMNPGTSQTYVRVPLPAEPQTRVFVRRTGPIEDFLRAVSFEGWEGIGGMMRLTSTHASAAYRIADHEGTEVWMGDNSAHRCIEALANHYGLPMPIEIVADR
ncbi:hypothetical protein ACFWXO_43290 [Kitasatospora sp. NPDC059088]|uniref:hypothetical protein n=1 Tax=Kitasatospora sp. NPDC059088 TaxID=3346722 RepID=UPI0036A2738D